MAAQYNQDQLVINNHNQVIADLKNLIKQLLQYVNQQNQQQDQRIQDPLNAFNIMLV